MRNREAVIWFPTVGRCAWRYAVVDWLSAYPARRTLGLVPVEAVLPKQAPFPRVASNLSHWRSSPMLRQAPSLSKAPCVQPHACTPERCASLSMCLYAPPSLLFERLSFGFPIQPAGAVKGVKARARAAGWPTQKEKPPGFEPWRLSLIEHGSTH